MTTIHGKNTGIVIGSFDVTRWCNEVSSDSTIDTAEASCFDEPQGAKVYVMGMRDTTYSYSAREQGTIDSIRQVIGEVATQEAAPFLVGIERGFHAGRIAQIGRVLASKLALSSPVADVVSVSGDLQADGAVYSGVVLTKKLPYEASTNGATVDLSTGAIGAIIAYHVVQNSRNGTVTVKVQDSVDGSTWVDYDTMPVPGGAVESAYQDMNVALDRFVRVVVTLAGSTGSATVRVAIARKAA